MTLLKSSIKQDLHIILESIYYLHRMGDHQAADVLLEESMAAIEKSPLHKKLSLLLHHIKNYELNTFEGSKYLELISAIKSEIKQSGSTLFLGWLHFLSGYHLKNHDDLKLAAAHFQEGLHNHELYEVFYWMDNFRLMPAEEKYITFLRTYPVRSIYSLIKGNKCFIGDLNPTTQIQKDQAKTWLQETDDDQEFDCWLISKNSLSPARYSSIDLKDESYLDLYSGLINDRGEFIFLNLGELNCLSYLISCQLTGATPAQMAEFLEKTEAAAEALIETLNTMGIKTKKINGHHFLQWEAKPVIIMPRGLKVIGLQEYVKKKSQSFSKGQLMDVLQLTQFGAETLMKKWALAGFIRPVDKAEKENIWKFL